MATNIIVRKTVGYSENPTFDALMDELATLAGQWRRTKDSELVRKYHVVLTCLLELGWDDELDLELELPKEHMPAAYFQRYR